MWWVEQTEDMKESIKKIVDESRLEFANGGWSATDEACPSFDDMINNFIVGHQFLETNFGIKPKVGWQMDSFGHSTATALLYSLLGYNAMFIGRIDSKERTQRMNNKTMQYIWRPFSKHYDDSNEIFTHTFTNNYDYPNGLHIDWKTGDTKINTNNIAKKTSDFIKYIQSTHQ